MTPKPRAPKTYTVEQEETRFLILYDGLVVGVCRFYEDVDAWFKARNVPFVAPEDRDSALGRAVYRL